MQSWREDEPHLNEDREENKNRGAIPHSKPRFTTQLNHKTQTKSVYLHEAPDMLLFLQEVLVESAPVGDKLEYFSLPEEGVFALLLASAASAVVGASGQGDDQGWLFGLFIYF